MGLMEDIAKERAGVIATGEAASRVEAARRFAEVELAGRVYGDGLVTYCSGCDEKTIHYPIGVQDGVGPMYNCLRCETTRVLGEVA